MSLLAELLLLPFEIMFEAVFSFLCNRTGRLLLAIYSRFRGEPFHIIVLPDGSTSHAERTCASRRKMKLRALSKRRGRDSVIYFDTVTKIGALFWALVALASALTYLCLFL